MTNETNLAQSLSDLSDDTLLRAEQAAELLTVAPATLEKWRRIGGGPVFVKLGRAVRYRAGELRSFVTARATKSTAEAGARRGA